MKENKPLQVKNIDKSFPGVKALSEVDFDLYSGEVHALLGENGAGKSTLIKILAGVHKKDSGTISIKGEEVVFKDTKSSLNAGISIIYQELNLIPDLSVAENIFIERMPKKLGFLKKNELYNKTLEILNELNIDIDPWIKIKDLPLAKKQMVEIAKAVSHNSIIIAMDEPTTSLTDKEIKQLFKLIDKLKKEGTGIIYISHKLEEIWEIADRVTVFRDGNYIGTHSIENLSRKKAVNLMIGRSLEETFPERQTELDEVILEVKNINRNKILNNISFKLHRGEVLGIAGLVGAGRTELVRAIFGADKLDSGEIFLKGKKLDISNTLDAIKNGIVLIPEDRKQQGLALDCSVHENIMLAGNTDCTCINLINYNKENKIVKKYIEKLNIKTPNKEQCVSNLSGGNQQKVVLAKWLSINYKVVIFDEPTRGIDVGTKFEIYKLINELAKNGVGVIVVSSELPEVIGLSDRILVMHEGTSQAILPKNKFSQGVIMSYATGEKKQNL